MLDCFTSTSPDEATPIDLITTQSFDSWMAAQEPFTANWVRANGFKGQAGRLLMIPRPDGARARIVYGLGLGDDPFLVADLPGSLSEGEYAFAAGLGTLDASQLAAAWALGTYRFTKYKKAAKTLPKLIVPVGARSDHITPVIEGVFLTRDLVNTPANDMGPDELEQAARDLAERHEADFTTIQGEALLEANFPLIHAVGRASTRAPRLLDLRWGPADAPKLTLVGKGVCFDSGGLNLKPGRSMDIMKKDMGGAAHVLGLAHMIMASQLPVRLRVLVPAVENAVSGNAFRPGDVYKSRKGLTVEIGNTDAEGRLVLADAIALADEEEPDVMIVMATLTGAARVALGAEVMPFYTDDDDIAEHIAESAEAVSDPVWRMPLHKRYVSQLDSRVADMNNISASRFGGSIIAALFLQKFASKTRRWVHFDIFAWNGSNRPGRPAGGDAQAIRALFRAMTALFSAPEMAPVMHPPAAGQDRDTPAPSA